jgi:NADH:ubiquinone oxidoreductase subunit 3 (subunit A)
MNHYIEIIIIIAIVFLVGIVTLILSYYLYYKSKKTLDWIEVDGEIEDLYVDKYEFVQEAQKTIESKLSTHTHIKIRDINPIDFFMEIL